MITSLCTATKKTEQHGKWYTYNTFIRILTSRKQNTSFCIDLYPVWTAPQWIEYILNQDAPSAKQDKDQGCFLVGNKHTIYSQYNRNSQNGSSRENAYLCSNIKEQRRNKEVRI